MTMKMLSKILAVTNLMLVWSGFSALPPIQHNYFTTNASPSMISSNAIAATNGFGTNTMLMDMKGTNAWFYSEGAAGNNFVIYGDTQPQITFQGDVGSAVIQGYIGLIIKPGPGGGGMGDVWITTNVYVHGLISTNVPMFLSTNLADQWWVSNTFPSFAVTTNIVNSLSTNVDVLYVGTLVLTNALGVSNGGTGSTNAGWARTNLEAASWTAPYVLSPYSGTNGLAGALNLTAGTSITITTNNGTNLVISSTASGGGPTPSNNIPVALSYSATNVIIDPSQGTLFRLLATNNFGLYFSAAGSDAQAITVQITQDATGSRTAWYTNTIWWSEYVTDGLLTTTPGKTDLLRFQYWTASNAWLVIGANMGFPR